MITTGVLMGQLRRLRPTVHKPGLVASKPVAFPLCHPIPGNLAVPRTRELLFLSLGVGPTWHPGLKRQEISMIKRPTAQKPASSTTYRTLTLHPPSPLNNPYPLLLRQLYCPREREEEALQCRCSHPGSWGFPLPPGLSGMWPKPDNLFLISCTFTVKWSALWTCGSRKAIYTPERTGSPALPAHSFGSFYLLGGALSRRLLPPYHWYSHEESGNVGWAGKEGAHRASLSIGVGNVNSY